MQHSMQIYIEFIIQKSNTIFNNLAAFAATCCTVSQITFDPHHNFAATMSEPYTVRLDANTARELATKGSTIVLLDVPEGTVIGMDQQVRTHLISSGMFAMVLL